MEMCEDNIYIQAFAALARASLNRNEKKDVDYYDSTGLLICGVCHKRKEYRTIVPGCTEAVKAHVACDCERVVIEAEEARRREREREIRIESLKRDGITNEKYLQQTFAADDRRHPELSDACRKYVAEWEENKRLNRGMLFYGTKGTGKTFYACCIANELAERFVSIRIESMPRMITALQGFERDKLEYINWMTKSDLLVIDDFTLDRNTPFGLEQAYNIIDSRYVTYKPTVITTNVPLETIKSERDVRFGKIYDRVLEMCPVRIEMTGDSRRSGRYI